METLEQYFERPDTPMPNSPCGRLMVRVLGKNPGMDFETARAEAHNLRQQAAGRRHYGVPQVLSPEEQAERDAKASAYWKARTAA